MAYQLTMQGEKLRKGPWFEEEDDQLIAAVTLLGERRWDALAKVSGLRRSGKSCRLRWMNYLRPNLKHGHLSAEEEKIIIQLHEQWGNKWSRIARRLPGRTDNEIKNYWRTHLRRKAQVQEQESNGSCNMIMKGNNFLISECDNRNRMPDKHDSSVNSFDSCDVLETSNFADYPCDTKLSSDWISFWSCEQNEMKPDEDYCNSDSCFYFPSCNFGAQCDDGDTWDCSNSIWDFDLNNNC